MSEVTGDALAAVEETGHASGDDSYPGSDHGGSNESGF